MNEKAKTTSLSENIETYVIYRLGYYNEIDSVFFVLDFLVKRLLSRWTTRHFDYYYNNYTVINHAHSSLTVTMLFISSSIF